MHCYPLDLPRHLTTHHDGHGINEAIRLGAGAPANGGASRRYEAEHLYSVDGEAGTIPCLVIQFQQGSTPGATAEVLYAILIDRLEGFQAGPFACETNARQLELLRECLLLQKARSDERAARGVLGKEIK